MRHHVTRRSLLRGITAATAAATLATGLTACGGDSDAATTSDANVFEAAGIPCVNVANGTEDNHEPTERVSVAALDSMLDIGFTLLEEAAAA